MMAELTLFLERCFSGAALPATILLILITFYWLLVMVGMFDVDAFDLDLDLDLEADGEALSVGFVTLRFLNLGDVPLMIWASAFALSLWTLTMLIDGGQTEGGYGAMALVLFRNAGISLFLTKLLTQPLRGRFDPVEPNPVRSLIGKTCVVTSSEVTAEFGQARLETDASPLQLHVRTPGAPLPQGTPVTIVEFDAVRSIYVVRAADLEGATDAD